MRLGLTGEFGQLLGKQLDILRTQAYGFQQRQCCLLFGCVFERLQGRGEVVAQSGERQRLLACRRAIGLDGEVVGGGAIEFSRLLPVSRGQRVRVP
ncbi:MAG: hypothetical protein ACOYYS_12715 [Chloroflexota bacterium]